MGDEETPFFGDWQKVRKLGSGGFGEVTLWKNRISNQCVAVKKCFLQNGLSKERNTKTQLRWSNEIDCMDNKIKCEYIVQTAQVDGDFRHFLNKSNPSGLPVLIMDYHDGGDLRRLLNKTENSNGLPEKEVKNVLKSLVGAIDYLHSINIAHRDIKPENIVIQRHNSGNLGYARELNRTVEASQVGTIGYFAPEVILEMQYSCTVDYWSFGIIAFEVICGCRPFIPQQTIPQWIKQLKIKGSKTIAITEDNHGNFHTHQDLFLENQISNCFNNILVPWFVLALEFHSKQRGYVFENEAPDEVTSPRKVLKIFSELEAALEKKILTVFAISSYKFLSYEITESMTLEELIARISVDTGILPAEIYLILPIERSFQITNNTRPIDLYQNENNDTPMVYMTRFKHALEAGIAEISTNLQLLLSNPSQTPKPWYLLECARHALFLFRNEQKHYVTLLRGIKYYALTLDHEISLFNEKISLIEKRSLQLRSALELCMATITYSQRRLEQKRMITAEKSAAWTNMLMKLAENMEKLSEAQFKVTVRYNSVLRRSKETVESSHSQNYNNDHFLLSLQNVDQDYLNVSAMERLYDTIREDKLRNSIKSNAPMDVYQAVCECLETRSKLLKSGELKHTQITIGEIHEEYLLIVKAVSNITKNIEKQLTEIKNLSERHIDEFAMIVEEATTEKCQKMSEDIPMIDGAMGTLKINDDAPNAVCVYSSSNPCSMDLSLPSFGDGPDARDIIVENRELLQSIKDFTMELEDLSHT